ncbi:hypothetical protein ACQKNB_14730 [Lysinibacillus xylanilyticus]|uniref:hypothetical protein n=1 Tax=Lysinibacillus xylanilyticus TaxID=582475 RepID=UPI003D008293
MGIRGRGTKAKSITSCDNAFVTNIVSPQAAHRTPSRNGNQPHVLVMIPIMG